MAGRTTLRRAAVPGAVAVLLVASAVLLVARGSQGQEQPTTGIILSASPASLSEGAASVAFTITARWASGTADIPNRTVSYTIALPSGATANPNTLTGTVTITGGQVSGSSTHTSLTLSNLENSVVDTTARNITISGSVTGAPSITVHSATVPIIDNDNAVTLTLSAAGSSLSQVIEGSTTRVTVTASLPSGTTALTSSTALTITVGGGATDTAASGTDFTASPGTFTLTIPANSLSGTAAFDLTALNNIPSGGSKSLTVSGAAAGFTFTNAVMSIADNPAAPPPTTTATTAPPPTTTATTAPPPATTAPPDTPSAPPPPDLADLLPDWSACLGPARRATKFIDVAGWDSNPAIRCAAYYGITIGRTPTQFAPTERVPRWQMALFMHRAAGPAGVELPEITDQGFIDLDRLTVVLQNAANAMSATGIMPGAAEGSFDPQGLVSRRSMAVILHDFLQRATLQKGVTLSGSRGATGFTDLGGLSPQERQAVERLHALGVVRGTTAALFAPDDPVTRVHMVQVITRALAYTIARPAGVTLQADRATAVGRSVDVVASVRDESFLPRAGARVDLLATFTAGELFTAGGACLPDVFFRLAGSQACLIDPDDPLTDQNGDLRLRLVEVRPGQGVWAWTGAVGDELAGLVSLGRITFTR